MVLTIPYDVLLNLLIGLWIGFVARKQLRNEPSIYGNPYFESALLFQIFVMLPIAFYLYLKYPDWSWMYFIDPKELPPYSASLSLLLYPAAMVLGYAYAGKAARRDQVKPIYSAMGATLFGLAMLAVSTLRRLWTVTTFDGYHQGLGIPIWEHPLLVELVIIISGILMVLGLISWRFLKEADRIA